MIAVGLMFALFLSVMNTSKCIKKQFFVEFFIVSVAFKLHRYVSFTYIQLVFSTNCEWQINDGTNLICFFQAKSLSKC